MLNKEWVCGIILETPKIFPSSEATKATFNLIGTKYFIFVLANVWIVFGSERTFKDIDLFLTNIVFLNSSTFSTNNFL